MEVKEGQGDVVGFHSYVGTVQLECNGMGMKMEKCSESKDSKHDERS